MGFSPKQVQAWQDAAAKGDTATPPKANRRAAGGRKAKRAGDYLEQAIIAGAGISGIVRLVKLPQHGARFVGKDKAIREAMPCDFVGTIYSSGRGIFIDAKSVGEERASLRVHDEKIVKRHQAVFLLAMADAGAVAGLLVECRRLGRYLWLGAAFLNEGAAIGWDDARWVHLGDTSGFPDFSRLVVRFCNP